MSGGTEARRQSPVAMTDIPLLDKQVQEALALPDAGYYFRAAAISTPV
jgi:hypothetical protein